MPGDRNTVVGGVWEKNDMSGAFILGEAAGLGTVHVVWGGYGNRVSGGPSVESAWEGSEWETELGNHDPLWGSVYLQDGLPDCWGTTKLPRQVVSMTGSYKDGDAGSFLPPVCACMTG